MKRLLILSHFLLFFSLIVFSQQTDNISKVPPLKKGKVILNDGTAINFKQLSVINDSVVLMNTKSVVCKYSSNDIYKISKFGNFAGAGALSGGLGGLLGAILGTSDWDSYPDLADRKSSFIVGTTLVCTALGGIIGACIKKDKTIYKSSKPLSFNTQFDYINKNKPAFLVICLININSK